LVSGFSSLFRWARVGTDRDTLSLSLRGLSPSGSLERGERREYESTVLASLYVESAQRDLPAAARGQREEREKREKRYETRRHVSQVSGPLRCDAQPKFFLWFFFVVSGAE
jgi:hypothetical protein